MSMFTGVSRVLLKVTAVIGAPSSILVLILEMEWDPKDKLLKPPEDMCSPGRLLRLLLRLMVVPWISVIEKMERSGCG